MREKEKRWIKSRIREYYENANISIPFIEKREFGIGNWNKKIEIRHLSFSSNEELKGFLIEKAPLYVSYSTSLYKKPGARPMEAKEREAVELTFDLDGEGSSLENIKKMKEELKKLLGVMKSDFGIRKYSINFSGNRGFHLHIYDKEYLTLSSYGRKRLISYLSGNLDYKRLFQVESGILYGPKISDKGYKGRFANTLLKIINENPKMLGRKVNVNAWKKAVETGNYGLVPIRNNSKIIEKTRVVEDFIRIKSIDVDAGVTYDISKLIRMPNSIHGSTGLVAKVLREDELNNFNPYEDALPLKNECEIIYSRNIKTIENGKVVIKRKGMKERINSSIALYLILKDMAHLPS